MLQNLQFPDHFLQISLISGSTGLPDLSTIGTLYLRQFPLDGEDYLLNENQEFSVYPNPASDVVYIKNTSETSSYVLIYRVDETLIAQEQISFQNQAINISNLTNGLYIFKINNQAFKIIKQ